MQPWCKGIKLRLVQAALFLSCFFSTSVLSAQTPFYKEFWINETNVPVRVNDLLFEEGGYIWVATDNGVYSFNGRGFNHIDDSIKKPVTAVTIFNGLIYAGFNDGTIGVINNGQINRLIIKNKRPHSTITSLHSTGQFLWVTTEEEGMFLIMNNTGIQVSSENGLTDNFLYDLTVNPDELMVSTDRGINHVRWGGKSPYVEVFTTAQGLPDNIVRVLRQIPGTRLCWIGTQEGGLGLYDDSDESFHQLKMQSSWAWGQVNDILPVSKNEAFVASEEGYLLKVQLFNDSIDVQPFSFDGLKINKIVSDKAGNIWCATNKGLMMNTAQYASQVKLPAPYQLKNVTALTFGKSGELWFSQNDRLYKTSISNDPNPEFILKCQAAITCLFPDRNGVWIGTFGKGLYYYSNGITKSISSIQDIIDGHILSIAGSNGRIWISSLKGVEETIPGVLAGTLQWVRHHNKLSGIGSDYVYQLYPDSKGRMWMATDGAGVCMYDNRSYQRWDTNSGLTSKVVYCITEDANKNIWAGTLEKGLFLLQGNKWQSINQGQGLENLNISSISGNATGEVIIVNEEGIDEWYPRSRQFRHYNARLGVDIDSTSAVLNCIARDNKGNVFVPFEHGFVVFNNLNNNYDIKPAIRIRSIGLFFSPLKEPKTEFNYDENHISFRYEGITFSNNDRLNYRYRLEGFENNWIYTNDEIIPFAKLPAGTYEFHVQAAVNKNFADAAEAVYSFTILKPFWQRTWFIAIVILLVFAAGYSYIRIRERGLRKMTRLQKERMVFEYEHLKSQVNPHFLFNSLNTLVNLIEDDKNAAVDYTVHLSDLYRNMLSYRDQDLILLAEEYEIIVNYMHIQKSRFGDALKLCSEIPEVLLKTKKIVPLALQLLVENAIKHNVVSLSKPLVISIRATEDEITISNPIQPKQSKERGAGLGLQNIRNRYGLLSNREIKFGIEDNIYAVTLPLL
jgi:ligand-binding sensor domain-containing protein